MRAVFIAVLLLAAPLAVLAQPVSDCRPDRVQVFTPSGRSIRLTVEVADTSESRAQGLMYRDALAQGTGMLFIYEHPQPVAFWMRNTRIPLDMLFIDAAGVIRHIHPRAVPFDETSIPGALPSDPDPARLMVLEIGGGEAARLGLREGAAIAHPALPAGALHPCD